MLDPEILERYAQAQDIAGRAGALALVYWRSRETLAIESKVSAQDIVSEADRAVERQIRAEIAANFPGDGFIGEEYGRTEGTTGFTWVIDPIDGTSPYLHGMPNWCVAIAVLRRSETVAGVISVPTHGEEFAAMRGDGAMLNRAPLSLPPGVGVRNAVTALGCSQHTNPVRAARMAREIVAGGGVFFNNGSGALMLAYVAAGRMAGCLSDHMMAWDCLAGLLIVREAGGRTAPFRPDGDFRQPDKVLATAPDAWLDLLRIMRDDEG
ncbi:inositol monophosphatase family protein [uncultured Amaricoccus sp.]|uniref:inositol monophosphatase family protein n=1 Tax=uncultured Amaricoccus sp. TaxID=339341 RepID=UPI002605EE5A|nr:inositol monophosphatase family protein [uncultured Amaricoccus sp.]